MVFNRSTPPTMTHCKSLPESLAGAVAMKVAILTPFLRGRRTTWGSTPEERDRVWPGDDREGYVGAPQPMAALDAKTGRGAACGTMQCPFMGSRGNAWPR